MFVINRNETIKICVCGNWNDHVFTFFLSTEIFFVNSVEHILQMLFSNIYVPNTCRCIICMRRCTHFLYVLKWDDRKLYQAIYLFKLRIKLPVIYLYVYCWGIFHKFNCIPIVFYEIFFHFHLFTFLLVQESFWDICE